MNFQPGAGQPPVLVFHNPIRLLENGELLRQRVKPDLSCLRNTLRAPEFSLSSTSPYTACGFFFNIQPCRAGGIRPASSRTGASREFFETLDHLES
jgi:hypothetical protein